MQKRILAFALVVCMFLSMMPMGIFAAETDENIATVSEGGYLNLSVNKTTIEAGETIEVLVSVSDAPMTKAVGVEMFFDDSVFEYVSSEWLLEGLIENVKPDLKLAALASLNDISPNGDVFKFVLRSKENISVVSGVGASVKIAKVDGTTYDVEKQEINVNVFCEHKYDNETDFYCNKCSNKRVVSKVEIVSLPNKTEYILGEAFEPDGGKFSLVFADGAKLTLDMTKENVEGFDSTLPGKKTLTARYTENECDYSAEFEVEVIVGRGSIKADSEKVYTGEEIKFTVSLSDAPLTNALGIKMFFDDSKYEFVSGEWLLKDGLITDVKAESKLAAFASVKAADYNGDIFAFTLRAKSDAVLGDSSVGAVVMISNDNGNSYGTDNAETVIAIECEHKYDSATDMECNKCSATRYIISVDIESYPNKTTYIAGEEFDPAGGKMKVTLNDGTVYTVDMTNDMVSGFNSDAPGKKSVTYKYGDTVIARNEVEVISSKVRLEGTKEKVYDGEEVEFTVSVENSLATKALGVELVFDDNLFELVSAKWLIEGLVCDVKLDEKLAAFADEKLVARNGDVFTFVLRAKSGVNLHNAVVDAVVKATKNDSDYVVFESEKAEVTILCNHEYDSAEARRCKKCFETRIPVSIKVTSKPEKLEYLEIKDSFDAKGGQITITYDNGTVGVIDMTAATVSGYDNTKVGNQIITVTYEGLTDSFEITVKAKSPVSVEVKTAPAKVEYLEGKDELDVAGGLLVVTYDNDTTKEVVMTEEMVSGFDNTKVGKQALTVTYTEKEVTVTTTFEITVKAKSPVSVEVKTAPAKIEYLEGKDELDVAGGVVVVTYDNGTTKEVVMNKEMISGFDNTKVGKQALTVTYTEKEVTVTTTFEITVKEKSPVLVAIKTAPAKVEYLEGKDGLDVISGVLVVTYDNDTTKEVVMTEEMISGFDNTKVGKQTLTVTYTEKEIVLTTTFEITVKEKSPVLVAIKTAPAKVEYLEGKDGLDVTGGVLVITYDNDTTKEVEITEEMISGFDNTKVGKQTLTVTYIEKDVTLSTTFEVTIKAKSLVSIEFEVAPDKLEYKCNEEELDIDGVTIKVVYDNDTAEIINVTKEMVSGFDNTKVGKQTVVITYADKTLSYEVEVISYVLGDVDGNEVVDSDDAIHLLYNVLFGEEAYPLNQEGDFDGNGMVDSDDAIYLLYNVLFGEENYPLKK